MLHPPLKLKVPPALRWVEFYLPLLYAMCLLVIIQCFAKAKQKQKHRKELRNASYSLVLFLLLRATISLSVDVLLLWVCMYRVNVGVLKFMRLMHLLKRLVHDKPPKVALL